MHTSESIELEYCKTPNTQKLPVPKQILDLENPRRVADINSHCASTCKICSSYSKGKRSQTDPEMNVTQAANLHHDQQHLNGWTLVSNNSGARGSLMMESPLAEPVWYSKVAHIQGFFSSYLRLFCPQCIGSF